MEPGPCPKGGNSKFILVLKDLEVTHITAFPFHWPSFKSLELNPAASGQTSTIPPCTREGKKKKVERKKEKKKWKY